MHPRVQPRSFVPHQVLGLDLGFELRSIPRPTRQEAISGHTLNERTVADLCSIKVHPATRFVHAELNCVRPDFIAELAILDWRARKARHLPVRDGTAEGRECRVGRAKPCAPICAVKPATTKCRYDCAVASLILGCVSGRLRKVDRYVRPSPS